MAKKVQLLKAKPVVVRLRAILNTPLGTNEAFYRLSIAALIDMINSGKLGPDWKEKL